MELIPEADPPEAPSTGRPSPPGPPSAQSALNGSPLCGVGDEARPLMTSRAPVVASSTVSNATSSSILACSSSSSARSAVAAMTLGSGLTSRVSGPISPSSSICSTAEPNSWALFSAIGSTGPNRHPHHYYRRRRRVPEQGEHSIDRAHGQMNLSVVPVINGPATVIRQDPSAQYSLDSLMSDSALTYLGPTTTLNSHSLKPTSRRGPLIPEPRCFKSRSGWNRTSNPVIGLKGGSDTANGTSGWGPPPSTPNVNVGGWGSSSSVPSSGGHSAATGTGGGWGSTPGGGSEDSGLTHSSQSTNLPPTSIMKSTHASVSLSGSSPAPAAPSTTSTSTSWAAAAGKGLPVSEATPVTNHNNLSAGAAANPISTSKQFEKLNSVREALFSPDGWGGSHVKQDTSWDTEPRSNSQDAPIANASARKDSGGPNNSSMWNGAAGGAQRNDGTDLWKSTLSGQPPPQTSKVQIPNNPWGNHTPQNPADFKTWGEEEDGSLSRGGGNGAPGSGGVPSGVAPPSVIADRGGMNTSHDSWKTGNTSPVAKMSNDWSKEPRSSWTESSHGSASRPEPLSDASGWGALPRGSNSTANWGGGGVGGGGSMTVGNSSASGGNVGAGDMSHKWNDDQTKRMPEESSGIGAWGHNSKGPNGMAVPSGPSSHWKDMPASNMMRGGGALVGGGGGSVVGPPMGPVPNRHSHGVQPKESWGQIPPTSGKAWGDDGTSWNEEATSGKSAINWTNNTEPGWNKPMGNRMRQSPPGGAWDENGGGGGPSFDNGPSPWSKVDGPGKPLSKDMIWSSKQFRILSEMGYRKDDIETALLQTQLRLDDALEMLNALTRANRHQVPPHVPDHVLGNNLPSDNPLDNPRVNLPYSPEVNRVSDSHYGGGMLTRKMAPPLSASPTPGSGHTASSQPSPHQLRVLVQQIQMAVQAGHLNPQILNQPLAPQTLILLNQLLHQIKTLQGLQQQQQQHSMARPGSNNPALMNVTVNITKTKQHISNLQNQISAQQANYLKGHVSLNPTSPLAHPQAQQQHLSSASGPGGPLSGSDPNTMQDMFHSLNLQNNLDNNPGNQGSANGGSRLAQWKLPKEPLGGSFPKAPGPVNAKSGAPSGIGTSFLLEDNTWSRSSTDGGGGWPDSGKGGLNFDGSDFGIPEFEPGKPWKGPGLKNPDEDPNLTPGSVAPTALPLKSVSKGSSNVIGGGVSGGNGVGDGGAMTMTSPTWSFGDGPSKDPWGNSSISNTNGSVSNHNLTQIGQDLWGKPVGNNWPNNGWSSNQGNNVASNSSSGGLNEGPLCLVLKNLTPQIDPSTLKTLCMQHGALTQFDVFPNHSTAVAVYRNGRDAVKAQKALNQCLLSNTAIHASTSNESDITAMLQRMGGINNFLGSSRGSGGGSSGNSSGFGAGLTAASSSSQGSGGTIVPSSPSSSLVGSGLMSKTVTTSSGLGNDMWTTGSSGGGAGPHLFSSPGSVWGAPEGSRTTTPLNSFLPGDLLGESGNP
ncbi:hypothetical protein TCAL_06828 [Tigriopus californicus]|uniref:RRM domain-containing protein n=1 Tax=Tigriopus californicus TaxID=6832 RepID=A0A553NS95_TIGCA|nr:protein Gawky-like [Tigriopus californicus]TRY68302.1 hypothetical protein TCAL_06828 [Tigriopus californicus]|eukprot:TCALIF_06828-PA protein Name:"Similar to gw Protein Gawky (Drosophila melanogaster)" AED:0.00 eAED:0.00 QI:343/1/1/1/1/1/6/2081/1485